MKSYWVGSDLHISLAPDEIGQWLDMDTVRDTVEESLADDEVLVGPLKIVGANKMSVHLVVTCDTEFVGPVKSGGCWSEPIDWSE